MKKLCALVVAVLLAFAMPACAAFVPTDPIMPLSAVKAGMKGKAKTVFEGTKVRSFDVTVLGIMKRRTSPKNLILIRAEDEYVRAHGGIASGMSGSPVYVNGKLIGAIGYGWSFADNSLGLVTPIEDMCRAADHSDKIPGFEIPKVPPQTPATSADIPSDIKLESSIKNLTPAEMLKLNDSITKAAEGVPDKIGIAAEILKEMHKAPEKKSVPLAVDGISERYAKILGDALGFDAVPLGSSDGGDPVDLTRKPEPGSAVAAAIAWGDFAAGGIGTLTALSNDGRFIAFAHPLFNRGAVSYALTDAEVIGVIPGLRNSFKLGSMGKIIGIVTQDRPEGASGVLGKLAAASSFTVNFHDADRNYSATRRFQTAADPFTAPTVGAMGIMGTIDDLWEQEGAGTALVTFTLSGGNLTHPWIRRNIFFSSKDVVKSIQKEAEAVAKIMAHNRFQEISPFGLQVDAEITRTPRIVYIEKIEIEDEKPSYKPGDKLKVNITLRQWRKRPILRSVELVVPQNALAYCEVTVRGGGIEEPEEEPLATGTRALSSFDELMKELIVKETNNLLIAEISGPESDVLKKKKEKQASRGDKTKAEKSSKSDKDKNKGKGSTSSRGLKDDADRKGEKTTFTPADLLEDRFVGEIKAERMKQGSLAIAETNYYVEGLLRKFIAINRSKDDSSGNALMQALAAGSAGSSSRKLDSSDDEDESDDEDNDTADNDDDEEDDSDDEEDDDNDDDDKDDDEEEGRALSFKILSPLEVNN